MHSRDASHAKKNMKKCINVRHPIDQFRGKLSLSQQCWQAFDTIMHLFLMKTLKKGGNYG